MELMGTEVHSFPYQDVSTKDPAIIEACQYLQVVEQAADEV
jgi:hypothetical protein